MIITIIKTTHNVAERPQMSSKPTFRVKGKDDDLRRVKRPNGVGMISFINLMLFSKPIICSNVNKFSVEIKF